MDDKHGINIGTRDRLMMAWQDSMELVRDFRNYAEETSSDREVSDIFSRFAETECEHAARFAEILRRFE